MDMMASSKLLLASFGTAPRFLFPSANLISQKTFRDVHVSSVAATTKLPNLPKKPLSAYFRFVMGQREALLRQNPGISVQDLAKLGGAKWSGLPDNEKQIYKDANVNDMVEWSEKKTLIEADLEKAGLLDDLKTKMKEERLEKALKKASISKRKLSKDLGKPKRPANGYLLFAMEKRATSGEKLTDIMKKCAEQWNAMDEEGKSKYVNEHAKQMEKYLVEKEKWEAQMVQSDKSEEMEKMASNLSRLRSRKREMTKAAKAED